MGLHAHKLSNIIVKMYRPLTYIKIKNYLFLEFLLELTSSHVSLEMALDSLLIKLNINIHCLLGPDMEFCKTPQNQK